MVSEIKKKKNEKRKKCQLIDWLIVGWLSFSSGKYFMNIQD